MTTALKLSNFPTRVWVNQPSTHQPCHKWHGTNMLAIADGEHMARAYFLSGPVIPIQVPVLSLSLGWKE